MNNGHLMAPGACTYKPTLVICNATLLTHGTDQAQWSSLSDHWSKTCYIWNWFYLYKVGLKVEIWYVTVESERHLYRDSRSLSKFVEFLFEKVLACLVWFSVLTKFWILRKKGKVWCI